MPSSSPPSYAGKSPSPIAAHTCCSLRMGVHTQSSVTAHLTWEFSHQSLSTLPSPSFPWPLPLMLPPVKNPNWTFMQKGDGQGDRQKET